MEKQAEITSEDESPESERRLEEARKRWSAVMPKTRSAQLSAGARS